MKKGLIAGGVLLLLGLMVWGSMRGGSGKKGKEVYAEPVQRREISQVVKSTGQIDPRIKVNISAHVIANLALLSSKAMSRWGHPFSSSRSTLSASATLAASLQRPRSGAGAVGGQRRAAAAPAADAGRAGILLRDDLDSQLRDRSRAAGGQAGYSIARRARRWTGSSSFARPRLLADRGLSSPLPPRMARCGLGTRTPGLVIATVADLSELLVEVYFDETDIVDVALCTAGRFKVERIPAHVYTERWWRSQLRYSRPQQTDHFLQGQDLLTDRRPEAAPRCRRGRGPRAVHTSRGVASRRVLRVPSARRTR